MSPPERGPVSRAVIELAVRSVVPWLKRQRDRYRRDPRAKPLNETLAAELQPFFGSALLERARFVTLHSGTVERPPFLEELRAHGLSESVLSSFTDVSGITYDDVVVLPRLLADVSNLTLVFHELVHVAQFAELGVERFLREYVGGWVGAGFRYEDIPMEIQARDLARRFESDPRRPFDVPAEVAGWSRLGRS